MPRWASCARVCRSPDALQALVDAALRGDSTTPARYSLLLIALGDDPERAPAAHQAIEAAATPQLGAAAFADRLNAALLLAPLGDPAAVPVLREATTHRDQPQVQAQGVLALAGLRDPSAVEAARAIAAAGDPALRLAACQVLDALAQQQVAGARAALAACPGEPRTGTAVIAVSTGGRGVAEPCRPFAARLT